MIPAGQTRAIRLTLDLSPRQPKEFELSLRDFDISISPELSVDAAVSGPIWWTIRGRVRSAIEFKPRLVDFGRQSELGQPAPSQRMSITTFAALRSLTATCTSPHFDVKVQRRSPEPSDSFDLTVVPHGALPRGEIRCSIAIVPELTDGRRLPPKHLEVRGDIVSDIEASPPSVLFGACPIGASLAETLTLRSLTGQSFTVTGVRCEGDDLSAEPVRATTSFGLSFEVKHKVGARGEWQGKLIFSISHSGEKKEEVAVPVSCLGANRQLIVQVFPTADRSVLC